MTISTNGTGIRPGVCTSLTRPSSPYEGMMIFETDTHRVLIWDNAAWVVIADTDAPPALQLVRTASFSSQTSVPLNNCFTNEFTNYRLVVDVSATSALAFLRFQLTSNGSPSAASYSNAGVYYSLSGGSQIATSVGNGEQAVSSGIVGILGTASAMGGFSFDIYAPNLDRLTVVSWSGGSNNANSGFNWGSGGAIHYIASSYNGINLNPASGNMSGTVRVYGYRD